MKTATAVFTSMLATLQQMTWLKPESRSYMYNEIISICLSVCKWSFLISSVQKSNSSCLMDQSWQF